jgi:hypothetical protein
MKNGKQKAQPLPNSLIESRREARHEARDTGTLRGWWRCAIGDVRDLLAAAKHGEEVEDNLDMAYAILEHLRLIVDDRAHHGCSCEDSKGLEQSLSRLNTNLYGAMMDILLAAMLAEDEGEARPVRNQIMSAIRQVPTLAEIGKLAAELGHVPVMDDILVLMVRHSAPTRCRYCGQEFR